MRAGSAKHHMNIMWEESECLAQRWRGDLTLCAKVAENAIDPNTIDTPDNYVNMPLVLIEKNLFAQIWIS